MAGIPTGGVAAIAALGAYAGWRVLDSNLQISSDVKTLSRMSKLASLLKQHLKDNYNVGQYWEDAVANYKNKVCVKFQDRQFTFAQFDAEVNKLANWALAQGYKPGDVVSVFMENSPEFIITYLAFAKIGIVSALINHNLRLKGLTHCILVSKSKAVFATPAIVDALAEIQAELAQNNVAVFTFGEGNTTFGSCLNEELQKHSAVSPSKDYRKGVTFTDQFAYIYTSGTTGLPKAAIISHARFFLFGCSFSVGYGVTSNDVCYTVLPLYHSSACLAVSGMIFSGLTVVIAKKFSATNFWKEATEANATVTQYIGELCRYLVNTPPGKYDRAHKIRIAIGNGLRPDVWGTFQERFNIPEIGEFYGSTEGNASLTIHSVSPDTRGAVGRQGFLLRKLTGFKLVRFDVEKEEIIRGKDGFCIECQPGEPGEFIGPIKEDNPLSRFDGYTDKAATNKKIITDVFVKGDKYVKSGDLLMRDKRGLFYFVDRIGDTFRWKGENVSTAEVAQVISLFPGIIEANVYGVQIPGKDGRACMAGLVYQDDLQFDKFQKYCSDNLPSYAVPIFVRKLKQVDITGTFKHQKVELRKEGIDLSLVKDPIFWLNPSTKKYEPFTHDSLDLIKTGKSKL